MLNSEPWGGADCLQSSEIPQPFSSPRNDRDAALIAAVSVCSDFVIIVSGCLLEKTKILSFARSSRPLPPQIIRFVDITPAASRREVFGFHFSPFVNLAKRYVVFNLIIPASKPPLYLVLGRQPRNWSPRSYCRAFLKQIMRVALTRPNRDNRVAFFRRRKSNLKSLV